MDSAKRLKDVSSIDEDMRMLIGIIADEETTTGFLLAGVGESFDVIKRNRSFLMVTEGNILIVNTQSSYEFRSKVACENDKMPLECNPYSRIAIYSASFGYIERESVQCPHNNSQNAPDTNAKQTCLVSYATETVMQICHGRRRCSITADAGTFGRPCKNDIPMHLKVVYTCSKYYVIYT
ncbi:protein eva-1 homolog C-like [Lucilia cuprina]|uniref:protein eva-1 homolog C-like n=1 Tax=Lucilia cuprina TaxID=7375 RepID=UPI001F05B159|nr:protein eva-1 homolog C-like [Lucilia cuprina]